MAESNVTLHDVSSVCGSFSHLNKHVLLALVHSAALPQPAVAFQGAVADDRLIKIVESGIPAMYDLRERVKDAVGNARSVERNLRQLATVAGVQLTPG